MSSWITPRVFHLQRDADVTGVSGTGRVADGILWPDGTVTVKWLGEFASEVSWPKGVEAVERVHGHDGRTVVVWRDPELPEWLTKAVERRPSVHDCWALVSGYVAGVVEEGSEDAVRILSYMHELRPTTAMFTGSVEDLRPDPAAPSQQEGEDG